jgi:hypothetical protein
MGLYGLETHRVNLKWKNVDSIAKENGEIIAAKSCVYAGDTDALKEWTEFRTS